MTNLSEQVLVKPKYIPVKGGGEIRILEDEERGYEILRPAVADEIVPGSWDYYLKDPLNPNRFIKTMFYPEVEWSSILELTETQKIYVRRNTPRDSEPPRDQPAGYSQLSLL